MKVLFIINGPLSMENGLSGGDIHALAFIKFLQDKEKEGVFVCAPCGYKPIEEIRGINKKLYKSIFFERFLLKTIVSSFFVYIYRGFISYWNNRRDDFQVYFSTSHLFHDVLPLIFLKKKNKVFVSYVHHIIGKQKRSKNSHFLIATLLEKFSFWILKKVGAIVFVDSEDIRKSLVKEYGFKSNFVFVTKNGIYLENIVKVEEGVEKNFYDINFCGRLHRTKGVFDLIDIIGGVKKYFPDISCAVIGDGVERHHMEKIITEKNLGNNIKMLGFLNEEEKIKTMKSSKLFILPSHEEGWGIVIGEALACKSPVIVYKLSDIVGVWGDLVTWIPCFKKDYFVNKICYLLKNEEKRNVISKKGFDFAKTIDWNAIIEKELSVINKFLKK